MKPAYNGSHILERVKHESMGQPVLKSYFDYANALYGTALAILNEPEKCDDSQIISGGILLIIGLEKLVKGVIYNKNPLMTLIKDPSFHDLKKHEEGNLFHGRDTISFKKALERIVMLYQALKPHKADIEDIITFRNTLVHNSGYIDIGGLERKLQIKIADFTEKLCDTCLGQTPEYIIGNSSWTTLQRNRDIYRNAEVLELSNRILFLQKRHTQKESLDCLPIDILSYPSTTQTYCPVCEENEATVAFNIGWDVDVDVHEQVITGVEPYPELLAFTCACGFTLSERDEVEVLFNQYEVKYEAIFNEIMSSVLIEEGEFENDYREDC